MSDYLDYLKNLINGEKSKKTKLKNRLTDIKGLKRKIKEDLEDDAKDVKKYIKKVPDDLRDGIKGSYIVNGVAGKIEGETSNVYGLNNSSDLDYLEKEITRLQNEIANADANIQTYQRRQQYYIEQGGE